MSNELKGGDNAQTLSTDINVITAEINAYQRVAGEAIFEIGRRLKYVKENDLVHGEFGEWLRDSVNISHQHANRFMRIVDELGGTNYTTSFNLGVEALYQIATMPESSRTESHEIPSTGETKTPDEMTVRELREVKRELKKTQEQRDAEQRERERLEIENSELAEREPEVRTEYIEKETREPYDRRLDEPYSVERGRAFYEMMNEVDAMYKKYAHLKDGIEELRGLAVYDEDMCVKYRKASEFWHMMDGVFNEDERDIIDIEII